MNNENSDVIKKSFNGLLVVKARNGNFNAGFDGNPRTLPDGTIFATDKALKYCIREYLATFQNEPVFVRRNRRIVNDVKEGNKLRYQILEENFFSKLKNLVCEEKINDLPNEIISSEDKEHVKKWVNDNLEEIKKYETGSKKYKGNKELFDDFIKDDKLVLTVLKSFVDIRHFGVVFAVSGNVSLTGPVQISYGVNKLKNSSTYPVQILSPYKNSNEKSENANQTTIGEETKADEVYYVYNISVNSSSAKDTSMNYEDLKKLKDALLNSVDLVTSCTKYGCESVALIWLNNTENIVLNNLDEFIEITKNSKGNTQLSVKKLQEYLKNYGFDTINTVNKEYNLKEFDFSEKPVDENKIQIIYKKGKIELVD